MTLECILTGRPTTKKNSSRAIAMYGNKAVASLPPNMMIRAGGVRQIVLPSKAYETYENSCLAQLNVSGRMFVGWPKTARLNLRAVYYMPDKRSKPDLVGLLQATQDILQKAGIVEDDVSFVSLDGSRIAGIDRNLPRVEIEIEEVES
ncbi:MAG: RusA family crossover junction endodeoxyribonuclease [bacterium]|nr:RusA family crossover junction endodeoxyribonuclease [bacterium]